MRHDSSTSAPPLEQLIAQLLRRFRDEFAEQLDAALARAVRSAQSPAPSSAPLTPADEPRYITPAQARQELGGCSITYLYKLLDTGALRSVNPGGRRRLIELASVRELLRQPSKKSNLPVPMQRTQKSTRARTGRAAKKVRT